MSDAVHVTSEAVALANRIEEATPGPVELARELGEENFRGDEHGQFEVRAVDRHGAPDPKKARVLREMFTERTRLEQKLTEAVRDGRPTFGEAHYLTFSEYHRRVARMTPGELRAFDERLASDRVVVLPRGVE